MRLKISDPQQVDDLIDFLRDHDACVTTIDANLIEVGFVNSLSTAGQAVETEHRLRSWIAAHRDVVVVVSG